MPQAPALQAGMPLITRPVSQEQSPARPSELLDLGPQPSHPLVTWTGPFIGWPVAGVGGHGWQVPSCRWPFAPLAGGPLRLVLPSGSPEPSGQSWDRTVTGKCSCVRGRALLFTQWASAAPTGGPLCGRFLAAGSFQLCPARLFARPHANLCHFHRTTVTVSFLILFQNPLENLKLLFSVNCYRLVQFPSRCTTNK